MCMKAPIYFSIKHISSKDNHIFNHEIKKDALQELSTHLTSINFLMILSLNSQKKYNFASKINDFLRSRCQTLRACPKGG